MSTHLGIFIVLKGPGITFIVHTYLHFLCRSFLRFFIYFAHSPFKYKYFPKRFIWPIDETLTGTITLGQRVAGSKGNQGVLHIPQISKIGASPSDAI